MCSRTDCACDALFVDIAEVLLREVMRKQKFAQCFKFRPRFNREYMLASDKLIRISVERDEYCPLLRRAE